MNPNQRQSLAWHQTQVLLAAQDYIAAVDNASLTDLGAADAALDIALDGYTTYRTLTRCQDAS